MRYKGIAVVGPLPGEQQYQITFAAAIIGGAGDTAAARALVDFLRTPEATAVITSYGKQPVRQ